MKNKIEKNDISESHSILRKHTEWYNKTRISMYIIIHIIYECINLYDTFNS